MSSQFAVYPIVDGCSKEAVFYGTVKQCITYAKNLLETKHKFYIILKVD